MIAIIPARGGSKGLPGKNIMQLLDKPLIAYTIEAAKNSIYITDVFISTDDEHIANIAVEYGAKSYFLRPSELAKDDSLAIDTYIYTIERLANEFAYTIDCFVVLQPTSPLRIPEDIDNAIELFKSKNADSVISYCENEHPIEWNKYIDNEGRLEQIFELESNNRQAYRKSYYPNGAIYVFDYEMIKTRKYYTENTYAYLMPNNRSVDIDTIEDFEYAEYLLRQNIEN